MKLIIDIPEDVYTRLFDNGRPTDIADGIVMERALRLGTPLTESDDCINRQATYQKMLELQGKKRDRYLDIDDVRVVLQGMPSVQPKRDKGDKK